MINPKINIQGLRQIRRSPFQLTTHVIYAILTLNRPIDSVLYFLKVKSNYYSARLIAIRELKLKEVIQVEFEFQQMGKDSEWVEKELDKIMLTCPPNHDREYIRQQFITNVMILLPRKGMDVRKTARHELRRLKRYMRFSNLMWNLFRS